MKNSVFAVELRGEGVYRGSSIVGYTAYNDETDCARIKEFLNKKYNLLVEDFHLYCGTLVADTDREDVRVIIQEISEL